MRKYTCILLVFVSASLIGEQSTQEVVTHLRESLTSSLMVRKDFGNEIRKCSDDILEIQETNLFVFISFSMSDEAILLLAQEVSLAKGVLILRGIPQNSFKLLAKKMLDLKEKGLTAEIQINPTAFQQHSITAIPSFVQIRENGVDKITGNISLSYALECFSKEEIE